MPDLNIFNNEGTFTVKIPKAISLKYPHIVSEPHIHSGWPHIKDTRILATDIFRASIKNNSFEKMMMEFKEIGIKVDKGVLAEACSFTIELLYFLNNGQKD